MLLPENFQFSATSLQDYADCPRRFQLRYLMQLAWPAPQVDPVGEHEYLYQMGREFHRLAHQYLLGIPADALSASVSDDELHRWWGAFLLHATPLLAGGNAIPEVGLSTSLEGHRLFAQYDALVFSDTGDSQAALILDWKTYRRRPSRTWFTRRLQTRIYPLVLVQAGASLIGGQPIPPEAIEMHYWLAEYPDTPEIFHYDAGIYQTDVDYVSGLVREIAAFPSDEIWPLTDNLRRCQFCNYRSLCRRGAQAGPLEEFTAEGEYGDALDSSAELSAGETPLDFDLDWGQVQEIAY
jgi:hypothetical protein